MKLEFYGQIFEKSSNIKFHENPNSGSQDVPCGQTDRLDRANCCIPPPPPVLLMRPKIIDTTNSGTFSVATHLDTNGSPSCCHSVTLKKKDIKWHFLFSVSKW
jgi:hypothetical protein